MCFLTRYFTKRYAKVYESLSQKEKPYAYFYASMENDSFTLLTLLRGKNLNYDSNWLRLAVPQNNFKIFGETVEEIVTAVDFESAFKVVLESPYSSFFLRVQNPEETIADAEKTFKMAILHHAKGSIISQSFSIGAALGFLTQKEAEVHNLTAVSSGLEGEIKADEIQRQLLF